jgi:hypothetical protein
LFILGLNIYAVGFLSGMIGNKGDLKQEILGALTAGFNAKVLRPMKAGSQLSDNPANHIRSNNILCPLPMCWLGY